MKAEQYFKLNSNVEYSFLMLNLATIQYLNFIKISGVTLLFWTLVLRASWTWKLVAIRQWPLGYLHRLGQHVDLFPHSSMWLCCTASDQALSHKKQNLNQVHMHYKTFIRQWNHKLEDAQAFCGKATCPIGQARWNVYLPVMIFTCPMQVLSYTLQIFSLTTDTHVYFMNIICTNSFFHLIFSRHFFWEKQL